jgi:hypothetical protein
MGRAQRNPSLSSSAIDGFRSGASAPALYPSYDTHHSPPSWPDLFRPSTPCCGRRQGVDTRHAPGMTAVFGTSTSRHRRFNCQTATALQTCDIAPVVCGAGAPSLLAFPPPCERACGTPGARCTLGPDAMRSSAIESASGLSEAPSKCPTFRLRCFFGCLHFASTNAPIAN